jgi:hypothetical protein
MNAEMEDAGRDLSGRGAWARDDNYICGILGVKVRSQQLMFLG